MYFHVFLNSIFKKWIDIFFPFLCLTGQTWHQTTANPARISAHRPLIPFAWFRPNLKSNLCQHRAEGWTRAKDYGYSMIIPINRSISLFIDVTVFNCINHIFVAILTYNQLKWSKNAKSMCYCAPMNPTTCRRRGGGGGTIQGLSAARSSTLVGG